MGGDMAIETWLFFFSISREENLIVVTKFDSSSFAIKGEFALTGTHL